MLSRIASINSTQFFTGLKILFIIDRVNVELMNECCPQHLRMRTSKNEIRQRNKGIRQAEKNEYGKE